MQPVPSKASEGVPRVSTHAVHTSQSGTWAALDPDLPADRRYWYAALRESHTPRSIPPIVAAPSDQGTEQAARRAYRKTSWHRERAIWTYFLQLNWRWKNCTSR